MPKTKIQQTLANKRNSADFATLLQIGDPTVIKNYLQKAMDSLIANNRIISAQNFKSFKASVNAVEDTHMLEELLAPLKPTLKAVTIAEQRIATYLREHIRYLALINNFKSALIRGDVNEIESLWNSNGFSDWFSGKKIPGSPPVSNEQLLSHFELLLATKNYNCIYVFVSGNDRMAWSSEHLHEVIVIAANYYISDFTDVALYAEVHEFIENILEQIEDRNILVKAQKKGKYEAFANGLLLRRINELPDDGLASVPEESENYDTKEKGSLASSNLRRFEFGLDKKESKQKRSSREAINPVASSSTAVDKEEATPPSQKTKKSHSSSRGSDSSSFFSRKKANSSDTTKPVKEESAKKRRHSTNPKPPK